MNARATTHRWARRAALALLLAAGCESSADRPNKNPPPPSPRPSAEAASDTAALPPSAAPTSSQAAASPDGKPGAGSSFAGSWQGDYDARKGAIELPPKVKDPIRGGDDGKAMAGAGKVELTVAADGDVRGKASGALGNATLTGKVDEGAALRASWFPDDPASPNAMTGVLIGLLKGDVIIAEIRVAGPDATLVREAKIELKRK